MGLLNLGTGTDINQGIEEYKNTDGATLIDVRMPDEYAKGRVPGSRNIPLQEIIKIGSMIPDKDTPLFVYCLSGARSRQAAARLQKLGYTKVKDIGGINSYRGELEK